MAVFLVMRVEAYLDIFQALPVRSLGAGKTEKLVKLSLTRRTPFLILDSRESYVLSAFSLAREAGIAPMNQDSGTPPGSDSEIHGNGGPGNPPAANRTL